MYPENLKYTKTHEWVKMEGGILILGITFYAQEHIGEIVFAGLPAVGAPVKKGARLMDIESTKAVAEIFSPCDGKIAAVNDTLLDQDNLLAVNRDPYGDGWLVKIETENLDISTLMDATSYEGFIKSGGGPS